MRSCWNELFILGLAQCAHVMNLSTILTAIINHLQSSFQDGTIIVIAQMTLVNHIWYYRQCHSNELFSTQSALYFNTFMNLGRRMYKNAHAQYILFLYIVN